MILLRSARPPTLRSIAEDRVVVIVVAVHGYPLELILVPRLLRRLPAAEAIGDDQAFLGLDRVAESADGMRDLWPLRRMGQDLSRVASLSTGI